MICICSLILKSISALIPALSISISASFTSISALNTTRRDWSRGRRLVRRAENWRFSSLWRRLHGTSESRQLLSDWPLSRPRSWVQYVNQPQSPAELEAIRRSVQRGQPYGGDDWSQATAKRLGLESTFRPRGRPKKEKTIVPPVKVDLSPLRLAAMP